MSTEQPVPASASAPAASAASPELKAASPYLKQAIAAAKAAFNTTFTGDPAQIGLRAGPAFAIFINQIILLEPGVLQAEEGVVLNDVNAKFDALAAKLP